MLKSAFNTLLNVSLFDLSILARKVARVWGHPDHALLSSAAQLSVKIDEPFRGSLDLNAPNGPNKGSTKLQSVVQGTPEAPLPSVGVAATSPLHQQGQVSREGQEKVNGARCYMLCCI
eukprot:1149584-Pelagomonas_calceolata.AAC.1